jgi:hypothetical protein
VPILRTYATHALKEAVGDLTWLAGVRAKSVRAIMTMSSPCVSRISSRACVRERERGGGRERERKREKGACVCVCVCCDAHFVTKNTSRNKIGRARARAREREREDDGERERVVQGRPYGRQVPCLCYY